MRTVHVGDQYLVKIVPIEDDIFSVEYLTRVIRRKNASYKAGENG